MTSQAGGAPACCDIEWVHVFEQDSDEGAAFLPIDADIPLSRRPRERFLLRPDGSGVIRTGGPDDRLVPRPAQWSKDGRNIVVRAGDGSMTLRIVNDSAERLRVHMR